MKQGLKTATTLTIVGSVLYALYLVIVSHVGTLPQETTLVMLSHNLTIELPFKVSCWWNLLIAPVALLALTYAYSEKELVGEEHRGHNDKVNGKRKARMVVHQLTMISLYFGVVMPLGSALVQPITMKLMGGPLSGLFMGIVAFLFFYLLFSCCMAFLEIALRESRFSVETASEVSERYTTTFVNYAKLGLLKTFPFLIGLTVGLMFRLTYEGIITFAKTIVQKAKKPATV